MRHDKDPMEASLPGNHQEAERRNSRVSEKHPGSGKLDNEDNMEIVDVPRETPVESNKRTAEARRPCRTK